MVQTIAPNFRVTRRGWGFIRVQLWFHDERIKPVDLIYTLKLDRTYTGKQTLGGESLFDVELDRRYIKDADLGALKDGTSNAIAIASNLSEHVSKNVVKSNSQNKENPKLDNDDDRSKTINSDVTVSRRVGETIYKSLTDKILRW